MCTKLEIIEKIQCFDDIPREHYEVLENSTVLINCIVRNQHGKVQWRAQNVVLGYDRSVPGLDRLKIIGDAGRGEHNLQISGIQSDDSGEYECQVQPVMKHPLLRRKTKITVLVPPTTPILLHEGKKITDNTLIINPLQNGGDNLYGSFLTIQCRSSAGQSDIQFIWYWNRKVITEVLKPSVRITTISKKESQIWIQTHQLKTNDKIRCTVDNKASRIMTRRGTLIGSMSEMVDIKFYAVPGHPEILNSSAIILKTNDENESFDIGCRVHPRGYPAPDLKWYWKFNNIFHSDMIDSEHRNYNKDTLEIKPNPVIEDQFSDDISTQLRGFRLSRFHHASNICCAINHVILKSELSSCVMIKVRFPPTKLLIILQDLKTKATEMSWKQMSQEFNSMKSQQNTTLIDGKNYRFACITNLHFTKLRLVWSLSYLSESREQVNIDDGEQVDLSVEKEFRQSLSYIMLRANRSMASKYLQCTAWPMNNIVLSTDVQLGIYYAPDKPHISGYASAQSIYEHETISLLCTCTNGYPLPDLHWYRDDIALSNREPVVSNGNMISSLLTFKVTREDNGKSIHCVAKNLATSDNGIYSNPIAIRTIFHARRVTIRTDAAQFKQIIENSILSLTCETDSSYPASDVQWRRIHCKLNSSVKGHAPCSKTILKESHREKIISEFNGWKTRSRLDYKVEWLDHNNFLECESRLTESDRIVPTSIQYDRIRLNVIYRPHFPKESIPESRLRVEENQEFNLNLKAVANPDPIMYTWFRGPKELSSADNIHVDGSNFIIRNIQRRYSGNYSVTASNEVGKTELKFYVDVTYPPTVNGTQRANEYINYGEKLSAVCDFDANPYSVEYVKWTVLRPIDLLSDLNNTGEWISNSVEYCNQSLSEQFLNNSSAEFSTINCTIPRQFSTISSYLTKNASLFSNAMLQCIYDNKITPYASKNFTFHIQLPPQHVYIKQFAVAAVQDDEISELTCIFTGYPLEQVHWYNCTGDNYSSTLSIINNRSTSSGDNNHTMMMNSGTYHFYQIRPNLYRSEITIRYRGWMILHRVCCQTKNDYGTATGTILIQSHSKPNKPDPIIIDRVDHKSIIIKLVQAFDGGTAQCFKIMYTEKGGRAPHDYQRDIFGTKRRNAIYYNISELQANTCYNIRVGSFNRRFKETVYSDMTEACTISDPLIIQKQQQLDYKGIDNSTYSNPKLPMETWTSNINKSTSFIVTVAGCVFGFVILIINVLTFIICYKRKQENTLKRRQINDMKSLSDRHVDNFSKFESSFIENTLYNGSIVTTTDSCCIADGRDKEEEIPMLLYPKSVCPLHFTTSDQYSNPLIIQDHYLQANVSCSQINDRDENSCYGCSSVDLPLSNVILSNQYIPFPIIHSPYKSIFNDGRDHSSGNSTISGHLQLKESSPSVLDNSNIIPLNTQIKADIAPPHQNRFINQTISDGRQSSQSPIFVRRQFNLRGND